MAPVVYYSLPFLEGAAVLLLIIPKYQKVGFILSSILLLSFTVYVAIAALGIWDKIPCGCGALIAGMSWHQHFFFNLFFLFTSFLGLYLNKNQNYFNK
ncbi:MauE/DoxX family redox-associated membrane protein [Sphingobacterium alimentarium]|uniref:MauE/DoxX family redox-associated membrane protein n=1 Tax=Sphingobacterium alimentarium TaxID=797292 RepID=UPI0037425814